MAHKQYIGKTMGIRTLYLDVNLYDDIKIYTKKTGSSMSKVMNELMEIYRKEYYTEIEKIKANG